MIWLEDRVRILVVKEWSEVMMNGSLKEIWAKLFRRGFERVAVL